MKKKIPVLLCVLAAAAVLGTWAMCGRQPVPSLTFDELKNQTGGEDFNPEPARALSYGWSGGPPTMDGESHSFQEPLTEEITALLEGSRYRRARDARPAGEGVMFQECSGCVIMYTAYWDGKVLWVPDSEGWRWIAYLPSEGFGEEVERILNTGSDKNT